MSSASSQRVVVIGAGIGGLVAALELASAGLDVLVVDKAMAPGGKLRQVEVAGRPIDAGPTVFTLAPVFEEIFARAGTTLAREVTLHPAEVLARHAWGPHEPFDLFADRDRTIEAIGRLAGPAEARRYGDFCRRAAAIYRTLDEPFMRAPTPSMAKLVGAVGLGRDLWRIAPFATLWRALGAHFHDPRLRQLFGRYATYCGASPFEAPATLMLVAHVEQAGVWIVEGGMHKLAAALARVAVARGATFRMDTGVHRILVDGDRASGVELDGGERVAAAAVVCNADVSALAAGLFGREARGAAAAVPLARRSLSAVTLALVAATRGFPLTRHNAFFPKDYAAEFDDLFGRRRLPQAPTVYVCAQDRDAAGRAAAPGPERLFCIVNAPATGDSHIFDASEIALCEERTFSLLEHCGLTVERRPEALLATTPNDFARMFPATGGAIYGAASHGAMASFRRPGARSRLPGLYLCGGSIHPGPGIPMAALSGRMAASSLLADRASTRPCRAAVTSGGMSTA